MRNIARRHKLIIEELLKDGFIKVQELSERLGVSEVTIRKDLKELEKRKMIYRNNGSASIVGSYTMERHIDEKEKLHSDQKRRIAAAAADLLQPNDKIIIASGTTLLAFARAVPDDMPITAITSSLKVSQTLCYKPGIDIVMLGGMMRKSSVSVIGHYAEEILKDIACTKLFLGVDGLDLDYGLTTSDMGESRLNRQMIRASQRVIILTDSSKFGKRGFSKICDLEAIDHIITDRDAPQAMVDNLREKGITVTMV